METAVPIAAGQSPWYRALDKSQWRALFAANLGWLFDGYETYALILTLGMALHQLLAPSQYARIPFFAGAVIAITLLGWGLGGILGGILADYIGRKRMMIYAMIGYSVLTGLTALSWSWISFALLRFLVGIAIGSEWGTGTAMVAELWPNGTRGKGAGLMQCGLGIGFFVASAIWLFVSGMGPTAWRFMFLLGIVPAFVTLWIRAKVPESALWEKTNQHRTQALERAKGGEKLDKAQQHLTRFTLVDLFADPVVRRNTIVGLLMSGTTTLAWWGISTWVPPYIGSLAAKNGLSAPQWASYAGMIYNVGAVAGYIALGFFADRFGRKPVTLAYFVVSLILTPVLFLWTHNLTALLVVALVNGFFTLGQYSWMPTWLPEIYPTHMRATGVAFSFNVPRFVAFLGPLVAGSLIASFGGYGKAASIVGLIYIVGIVATPFFPETNGKLAGDDDG
ncbi:MFS transporter [bacterium]|nr:MAG: MFS transporter [bacterium]